MVSALRFAFYQLSGEHKPKPGQSYRLNEGISKNPRVPARLNSLIGLDSSILEQLHLLRSEAVQIAIDDFGVGYSSLSYLKDLPVDRLKIDRSFIAGLPADNNLSAIVNTIIALGENLGFVIIAEGIETDEQRLHLLDAGCHEGQGFFFGKSMSPDLIIDSYPGRR